MSVGEGHAAGKFLRTWEYYADANPAGMGRHVGGATACVTTVPVPILNGVYVAGDTVDLPVVRALLEEVSTFGAFYCLQGRPVASRALAGVAGDRGLVRIDDAPLMALQRTSRLGPAQAVEGLVVRELGPDERHLHNETLAAGYGAPVELIDTLVPPELFTAEAVRFYAGLVDGEAVSTGMAVTIGATVGVFNVATAPEHQRRGFGGAVTARLVADAVRSGATLACLQSSAQGLGVYERLGFHTVERWPCWITAPVG